MAKNHILARFPSVSNWHFLTICYWFVYPIGSFVVRMEGDSSAIPDLIESIGNANEATQPGKIVI